jgi:hypothetical protein
VIEVAGGNPLSSSSGLVRLQKQNSRSDHDLHNAKEKAEAVTASALG